MDPLRWEHVATDLSVPAKPNGLWTLAVPFVAESSIAKVIATGSWTYAANQRCTPDGVRMPQGVQRNVCLNPSALVGSLIAKVGGGSADVDGTIVGIGHHGILVVPEGKSGPLYLTINDTIDGIEDNGGELAVQVFVAPAPEGPKPSAKVPDTPASGS